MENSVAVLCAPHDILWLRAEADREYAAGAMPATLYRCEVVMPTKGLNQLLASKLDEMKQAGRLKGKEAVIRGTAPPAPGKGRRYLLEGEGERPFLRMNSNSYLGM
jgi:hypothetical protein